MRFYTHLLQTQCSNLFRSSQSEHSNRAARNKLPSTSAKVLLTAMNSICILSTSFRRSTRRRPQSGSNLDADSSTTTTTDDSYRAMHRLYRRRHWAAINNDQCRDSDSVVLDTSLSGEYADEVRLSTLASNNPDSVSIVAMVDSQQQQNQRCGYRWRLQALVGSSVDSDEFCGGVDRPTIRDDPVTDDGDSASTTDNSYKLFVGNVTCADGSMRKKSIRKIHQKSVDMESIPVSGMCSKCLQLTMSKLRHQRSTTSIENPQEERKPLYRSTTINTIPATTTTTTTTTIKTSVRNSHDTSALTTMLYSLSSDETLSSSSNFYAPLFDHQKLEASSSRCIYDDLVQRHRSFDYINQDSTCEMQPRDYAIKELLTTEENYVATLEELIQEYRTAMSTDGNHDIFDRVNELFTMHQGLLMSLCDACRNTIGRTERLANVFIGWQDRFLIYGDYCVHLQRAQHRISVLRQTDPSFYRVLSMCRKNSVTLGKFRLEDLLVVPFQRVLKYHLLLSNIQRYETGDSDRAKQKRLVLQEAIEAMNDVNNYMNEIKRDSDNLKIINSIQSKMLDMDVPTCPYQLQDYGRLLMDGQLKVKLYNQDVKTRNVFLLEKGIIIAKAKGDKFVFKTSFLMSQMRLENTGDNHMHKFSLRDRDFLTVNHHFYCHSKFEKNRWTDTFLKALSNLTATILTSPQHKHEFVYSTISAVGSRCQVCKKYLTGYILQGFKCRVCGYLVHRDCIQYAEQCKDICPKQSCIVVSKHDFTLRDLLRSDTSNSGLMDEEDDEDEIYCHSSVLHDNLGPWCIRNKKSFFKDTVIDGRYSDSSSKNGSEVSGYRSHVIIRQPPANVAQISRSGGIQRVQSTCFSRPIARLDRRRTSCQCKCQNADALIGKIWFCSWARCQAEQVLNRQDVPDNTFLIRPRESDSSQASYSVSLKHANKIYHIRIQSECEGQKIYFLTKTKTFSSVEDLVAFYMENSLEENFPPVRSHLMYPMHAVLRFSD